MKIKKSMLAFLLILSTSIMAEEVKNVYIKVNDSSDSSSSIYIGASKDIAPTKTDNGDILFVSLIEQNVTGNGKVKGNKDEFMILADCEKQVVKVVTINHRDETNKIVKDEFPFTGSERNEKIIAEVNNTPAINIPSNTLISNVVDAGCAYIYPKTIKEAKPTLKEWTL